MVVLVEGVIELVELLLLLLLLEEGVILDRLLVDDGRIETVIIGGLGECVGDTSIDGGIYRGEGLVIEVEVRHKLGLILLGIKLINTMVTIHFLLLELDLGTNFFGDSSWVIIQIIIKISKCNL